MMQTDVSSAHLNESGYVYIGRTRLRAFTVGSTASGGTLNLWDTTVAPVTGTYGQSGTTVTVTKVAHGLATGDKVGIVFAVDGSGISATNGNYTVTRLGADTFSITDINSRTITAPVNCQYVSSSVNGSSQWHMTIDLTAVAATVPVLIPGEGVLVQNGIYLSMTNLTSANVYYG